MAESDDAEQRLVADLAREFLADQEQIAHELAVHVHRDAPGLPDDQDLQDDTLRAGHRVVIQVAERLRDGVGMEDVPLPPLLVRYAEEYVHRGLELPVLLSVVRVGYATFARQWSDRMQGMDAAPDARLRALASSLLIIFAYADAVSTGLATAYTSERERWSRSVDAMRADAVGALLAGRPVDLEATQQRLGHRLDLPQLAFVVWGDPAGSPAIARSLESAARRIADATGASTCLLIALGGGSLAGWIAGEAAGRGDRLLEPGVLDAPVRHDLRGAIGRVAPGIDGFRASHEQALRARRVAEAGAAAPNTITSYHAVALQALSTADPQHAAQFVHHELGALASLDEATRRVAETLRVYLGEGRNRARTARRLGLHSNTIAYRLGQAATLLGHDLNDRAVEVEVALVLLPLVTDRSS